MHEISMSLYAYSKNMVSIASQFGEDLGSIMVNEDYVWFEAFFEGQLPENTLTIIMQPNLKLFYKYFFTNILKSLRGEIHPEDNVKLIELVLELQKNIDIICEDTTSIDFKFVSVLDKGVEIEDDELSDFISGLNEDFDPEGDFDFELSYERSNEDRPWDVDFPNPFD